MRRVSCAFRLLLLWQMSVLMSPLFAQVNTGGTATTANHQKQVIGYLTNWDAWKATNAGVPAPGSLNHLNIDYAKYTILNYSFFGVASDGSLHSGDLRNQNIHQPGATQPPGDIFYVDPYSSWDLHLLFGELELIQHLSADAVAKATAQGFQVQENGSTWSHPVWGLFNKPLPVPIHKAGGAPGVLELAHSKGVKVMASIGGWSMCKHFPEMAADPAKRQRFINDCIKLINIGFDGIDLDWEFPGPFAGMNFTGTPADFANFTTLIQQIRSAIGPNKLITAALAADPVKLQGFQWATLGNLMNYFNIMTYDYNGGWSNKAGHNSPLFNYDNSEASTFNWKSSYDALVSLGVPRNKVNMGSPFYGRGVITSTTATLNGTTLKRQENVQPDGSITTCADFTNWPAGVYDGTPNFFYVKQVALAPGSGWTRVWDNQAKVPYLTKANFFLSYDDEESIGHKAQFIVDNQLAGTIIWTVFGDLELSGTPTSFSGKLIRYSTVKSTLVNKINEVFAGGSTGFPVVSITSPANGANFASGASVIINTTASDANGSITKVEFLQNGTKVGEDVSSPYSFTITNIPSGNHTLATRAIDNSGNAATASVTITAGNNPPPAVSVTAPANGAAFAAPASVTITANASDNGSIVKVEFFQGSTKLGEDTSSPYSFSWVNVIAGNYSLTAKATDNAGASITSPAVNITVSASTCSTPAWNVATAYNGGMEVSRNGNKYQARWWTQGEDPSVKSGPDDVWRLVAACGTSNTNPVSTITSPPNNAGFTSPASITINATATDSDGTITKVDFYSGASLLGTDNTSPFSFNFTNVVAGSYALTAKATDNGGGTGTSAIVNITVSGGGSDNCSSIPQYVENGGYSAGSNVKNAATQYECKPFPFSGWCNGAAWTYAPGTGTNWQDAWIVKGACQTSASARTKVAQSGESYERQSIPTEDGLTFYPNPAQSGQESITLMFETSPGKIRVQLKDANGREVFRQQYGEMKDATVNVELPALPSGLYFIRVQGKKQSWLKKYIVKK